MNYCVYMHTNKQNGKKYIGITGSKPEIRWKNGAGYKTSRHFYFAILKFGWDGFEHEILFEKISKERACEIEKDLICKYRTNEDEFGYNLSAGGESGAFGLKQSEETIEKRRLKHLGRKTTKETREKMSKSAKGRTFSKETLEKMSKAKKGIPLTDEHKANMSKALTGRKMSEQSKIKSRAAKESEMVKVYCKTNDTVYDSIQGAAKDLGLFATNICAVCKGKHKHTKGYEFEYFKKIEEYKSPFGG